MVYPPILAQGLRKGDKHPAYTPVGVCGTLYLYLYCTSSEKTVSDVLILNPEWNPGWNWHLCSLSLRKQKRLTARILLKTNAASCTVLRDGDAFHSYLDAPLVPSAVHDCTTPQLMVSRIIDDDVRSFDHTVCCTTISVIIAVTCPCILHVKSAHHSANRWRRICFPGLSNTKNIRHTDFVTLSWSAALR